MYLLRSPFKHRVAHDLYRNLTTTYPAEDYVGFNQSLTIGTGRDSKLLLKNTAGIVDTGTTLLLIASGQMNFASYLDSFAHADISQTLSPYTRTSRAPSSMTAPACLRSLRSSTRNCRACSSTSVV